MHEWIKFYGYDEIIIATKSDKQPNNEIRKSEKVIRETLKLTKEDRLYFFSSLNKKGKDELVDNLFRDINPVEIETINE